MRLVETHVSFIFITDRFVYKVKKAVDFGFLNFTTLDRRRFYCEEEVRLNRRLCPDIYLGVVELREAPGGLAFGGPGKLVDYAVQMKRLPEEGMLDRMLARGGLTASQLREIARTVARFHLEAARGPQIDTFASPAALRANWQDNFQQAAPFVGRTIARADLDLLRGWVERFLTEKEPLLRARIEGGFIRECDGDLHLGNICLTEQHAPKPGPGPALGPEPAPAPGPGPAPGTGPGSRVCIFDCIEFNDKFRFTDTAADVAFLLMDLEFAGRADLCPPFLETYRAETGDTEMGSVLDFYQANRAFIRGKVKSLRLFEAGVPEQEFQAVRQEAQGYFRLARGYCLRERLAPSLLITCGLTGSGKSALSRQLCRELGIALASSDRLRKELAAAGAPTAAGPEQPYDGGIYTPEMNRATYQALKERARQELAAGRSVLVDATFRRRGDREEFRALAAELGVRFFVLRVDCPVELIRQRLERRRGDPREISDGRWEIFPQQQAEFEAPGPGEAIEVDSALPVSEEVDLTLRAMGILP